LIYDNFLFQITAAAGHQVRDLRGRTDVDPPSAQGGQVF
jgi:hypothetical protein